MMKESSAENKSSIVITSSPLLWLTLGIATLVVLFVFWLKSSQTNEKNTKTSESSSSSGRKTKNQELKAKRKTKERTSSLSHHHRSSEVHPWLLTTLKAHKDDVLDLDFSQDKRFLASCSEDRTLLLWNTGTFAEKKHKSIRASVDLDHAVKIRWSPDTKAFVIFRACGYNLSIYGVTKKGDGTLQSANHMTDYPEIGSDGEIIGMGIASTGKYMMTCNNKTTMTIWTLKGAVLATVDTLLINTYCATVSPCGRFVGASGFTSEVKVWTIVFNKTGEFKSVSKAYDLKGHTAGIPSFAFSDDATRMASVSKDNTWKLWDTNVDFAKGEEPTALLSGNCKLDGQRTLLTLSPDARVVAIAIGEELHIYSAAYGTEEQVIVNEEPIACVCFDPLGKQLLAAVGRHIHVFHNVVGYRVGIEEMEKAHRQAKTESTKERVRKQINEARCALKAILKQ